MVPVLRQPSCKQVGSYLSHSQIRAVYPHDMSQHLRAVALIHSSENSFANLVPPTHIHNAVFSRCLLLHSSTISGARRNIYPLASHSRLQSAGRRTSLEIIMVSTWLECPRYSTHQLDTLLSN